MKRNLTVHLDDDVIRKVKVVAAERGTSVSGLVTRQLIELVDARDRYVRARESALRMMDDAVDRGGRTWRRDDLHDRAGQ